MKKLSALLLTLVLLLSLCACGGEPPAAAQQPEETAAAPAPESEPAPSREPEEPEVTYIEKTVTRLASITEVGIAGWRRESCGPLMHCGDRTTAFLYDEFGNLTGENVSIRGETYCGWLWDITCSNAEVLEYDEAGNLVSATRQGEPLNSWGMRTSLDTTEYFQVENDLPVLMERYATETGEKVSDTTFEYREDGSLLAETTQAWMTGTSDGRFTSLGDAPFITRIEFNEDGRYTFCHQEFLFGAMADGSVNSVAVREYHWDFDEAGNPVKMDFAAGYTDIRPVEEYEVKRIASAEMVYDEQNRMIAGKVFDHGKLDYNGMAGRDPVETEFTFTYDEEGRLALCEATAGGSTVTTEYLYNEDGWISSVRSGNMETTYTWETVEDGLLKGTASNTDLNIFPDSTELYIPADEFDADGNLTCAYRYAVQPSAFSLIPTYIKHQTYWNYETVTILEEAAE